MTNLTEDTTLGELRELLLAYNIELLTFGFSGSASGGGPIYTAHVLPFAARDVRATAATPWEALAEALRKAEHLPRKKESR